MNINKVLMFNGISPVVHILLIIEKTRPVIAFVPGRESASSTILNIHIFIRNNIFLN